MFYFDVDTSEWQLPQSTGKAPAGRALCAMALHQDNLFIYGGGSGNQIFGGLYLYNTTDFRWDTVSTTTTVTPGRRVSNTFTSLDDKLILFGGKTSSSRKNDIYVFDINEKKWGKIHTEGDYRPEVRTSSVCSYFRNDESEQKDEKYLLIFGGYKGARVWLNDLLLLKIQSVAKKNRKGTSPMETRLRSSSNLDVSSPQEPPKKKLRIQEPESEPMQAPSSQISEPTSEYFPDSAEEGFPRTLKSVSSKHKKPPKDPHRPSENESADSKKVTQLEKQLKKSNEENEELRKSQLQLSRQIGRYEYQVETLEAKISELEKANEDLVFQKRDANKSSQQSSHSVESSTQQHGQSGPESQQINLIYEIVKEILHRLIDAAPSQTENKENNPHSSITNSNSAEEDPEKTLVDSFSQKSVTESPDTIAHLSSQVEYYKKKTQMLQKQLDKTHTTINSQRSQLFNLLSQGQTMLTRFEPKSEADDEEKEENSV